MSYSITRYHDFSCGHRVVGHEGKCKHLHGHNYRIYFTVKADKLDDVGRVVDFSVVKSHLCQWLEDEWDHKFLAWEDDYALQELALTAQGEMLSQSFVWVPFNPTAENMAQYLVEVVGPEQLVGTGTRLVSVVIEETRKCSATYTKE